ncbi:MAG: outer membrane beta-barrel protein [Candidatus Cloacimonetes bacterium]|nr:outer membrane beta-barrel protein [Candidatus Cloacimonadota bacterium]
MKRSLLILALSIFLIPALFASQSLNVRLGFLAPSGAKTGIFPGLSLGYNVDNIVEMGLGLDYYYSNDREMKTINVPAETDRLDVEPRIVGSDLTTYYLPLMATLKVGIPADLPVIPYGGVGLGWGLLWEKVFVAAGDEDESPSEAIDEVNFYNGFNWMIQLGAKYPLSTNINVYGEGFYNGGVMKKNIQKDALGITWDEVKMSGIGLRAGLEIRLK